jgi:peptidyl-prolyl cis-trans isomerase A (cyclophilin A)
MKKIMRQTLATLVLSALGSTAIADTIVSFNTNLGSFQARLFDDMAPISVANFMRYVDAHLYDQTLVHRSVPGFVIQGGGYYSLDYQLNDTVPTFDPIPLENPYGNYRGTLSMARTSDPDSARSQWFINLVDNSPYLDSTPDLDGYAVFGEIIGDGMAVVDSIAALPTVALPNTYTTTPILNNGAFVSMTITQVPEPNALHLIVLGLVLGGLGLRLRKVISACTPTSSSSA